MSIETSSYKAKISARTMVGDGQDPNRFFVTSGPYVYREDEEIFESIDNYEVEEDTVVRGPYETYEEAKAVYDKIRLDTEDRIGQVLIEDRKSGVITEKYFSVKEIVQRIEEFKEHDDAKLFGYVK